MARSGVETVRTVFDWSRAQPAPGVTSFTETDRLVTLAAAHRIDLLPVVIYSPGWAAEYAGQSRLAAARGVRLRGLPHPARRAVRPEGQLLGRAPRAAEDSRSAAGRSGTSPTS